MELLSIITLVIAAVAALVALTQMSAGKKAIKQMEEEISKNKADFKNKIAERENSEIKLQKNK